VGDGLSFAHTGTCTANGTTLMANIVGSGVVTAGLEFTCIGCAFCGVSGMVLGVMFDPIGTCTAETNTTSRIVGSGADTVELVDTCTACASSSAGLVQSGL